MKKRKKRKLEHKYRINYPDKEVISKNKVTSNCYRKIRDCFKQHYIEENFDNPMQPKEEEFLQWIKKFVNTMEKSLLKNKKNDKAK